MPDLAALTTEPAPGVAEPLPAEVHDAIVLDSASAPGDPVRCVRLGLDGKLATDPMSWTPVTTALGVFFPKKGDPAHIIYPADGPPAIHHWEPKALEPDVSRQPLTLEYYGAAGDMTTDDTPAVIAAIDDLAGTGQELWVPAGKRYGLTEPIEVDDFILRGSGVHRISTPGAGGSVLALMGGLENTASHAITIRRGGRVEGLTLWYPSEVVTNASPVITATGYCVRLENTAPRKGGGCTDCYFVNVPFAISNAQGWSEIERNKICATKVAIQDEEEFAEHQINHNQVTMGLWEGARAGAINAYIAQNAIAFKLTKTLGTFIGNTVFGYRDGVRFEGYGQFFNWVGGLLDGCRYPVRAVTGAGPIDATFTGVTLGSLVAGRAAGVRDDYATIESNCVLIANPASAVSFSFVNCKAEGANGDLLNLTNATGAGKPSVSIVGGNWNNPGRFAHSHTMPVSTVVGTFAPSTTENNGDLITGGTSKATARVRKIESGTLYLDVVLGTFSLGETVTGGTSGATAKVTSIAQAPRFTLARFNDEKSGDLKCHGVHSDWKGYQWPSGIWFVKGGLCSVLGCTFVCANANAQASIQVNAADRFVENGNVSSIPGSNPDVNLSGISSSPAIGPSSWSRPSGLTVASAESMSLPLSTPQGGLVKVSGTAEIKTIPPTYQGHSVVLVFSAAAKLVKGENLKLIETKTTSADDAVALICDGASWFQISPLSPN